VKTQCLRFLWPRLGDIPGDTAVLRPRNTPRATCNNTHLRAHSRRDTEAKCVQTVLFDRCMMFASRPIPPLLTPSIRSSVPPTATHICCLIWHTSFYRLLRTPSSWFYDQWQRRVCILRSIFYAFCCNGHRCLDAAMESRSIHWTSNIVCYCGHYCHLRTN
jgi:hypothetical protein